MNKNDKKDDLREHRPGPLTVLQLMGVLAVLGIVLTLVLRHYFG